MNAASAPATFGAANDVPLQVAQPVHRSGSSSGFAGASGGRKNRQVLVWVERQRAAGLGLPAPGPPDADFEALLVQLRSVAGQARDATLAGQPATRLRARQTALEQQLRLAGRHARGERSLDPVGPAGPRALLDALGGQGLGQSALLELVEVDSELYAVVLARGRASLHALGPARAAVAAMEQMRFAAGRKARERRAVSGGLASRTQRRPSRDAGRHRRRAGIARRRRGGSGGGSGLHRR